MKRVHSIHDKPLAEVGAVAVAIGTPGPDQRHVGILHRSDGEVLLLHLRWHHRLANDAPDPTFLWVDPAIHPRRLTQVAAVCRHIWRANQKGGIPYAFSPPNDCFDADTGAFLFGPTRHGLTCATFVLAVFHQAGLPLVHYGSWPVNRPGDAEWQESIINLLERTGATPEHVAEVKKEIGAARYRPEEVAGAATSESIPAEFAMASERAQEILLKLG